MLTDEAEILLFCPKPQPASELLYKLSGILHPLGLGYIAGYLMQFGYRVKLLDNTVERLDKKFLADYMRNCRPKYVGISLYTGCLIDSLDFAKIVKDVSKDIVVIAGGPHASALPKYVLRHEYIDFVVKGEGEKTTLELITAIENKSDLTRVAGIIYRKNGNIIENASRRLIEDLDTLPLPAYELMPMNRYYLAPARCFTKGKAGSIITSRGCPQRCTFCSRAVFGKTVRYRSPEAVVDEIEYLIGKFGITELEIRDDTFTLNEARAIKICRLIQKRKLNILWNCCGRVDRTSDELFSSLHAAGCRAVFLGAETGSQEILDRLKKDITLRQIETAVRQCRKHRMFSLTSFIIGTPYETDETLQTTIDFARKTSPDFVSFCAFTPTPGSELFDDAVARGSLDIENANWENYQRLLLAPPPESISNFSKSKMLRWQRKAIRRFYFRPQYIIKRLTRISSLVALKQTLIGLYIVIRHQLRRIRI